MTIPTPTTCAIVPTPGRTPRKAASTTSTVPTTRFTTQNGTSKVRARPLTNVE
jgi:hypothetical protein